MRGAEAEPVQVELVPTVRPDRTSARRFGGMLPGRPTQAGRLPGGMFGFAVFADEIEPGVGALLVPPVVGTGGALMALTTTSYGPTAWTSYPVRKMLQS